MNDESSVIEKFEQWARLRHQHAPASQENPQETHMTRIADVKNVINGALADANDALTAIAANPLIGAIAEAGIGRWMTPAEISGLVELWREVEHYRAQAAAAPKIDLQPEQPTSAQQLQPQQTA